MYDEEKDPYEWRTVAGDPQYPSAKAALGRALRAEDALDVCEPPHGIITAAWEDEAFKE